MCTKGSCSVLRDKQTNYSMKLGMILISSFYITKPQLQLYMAGWITLRGSILLWKRLHIMAAELRGWSWAAGHSAVTPELRDWWDKETFQRVVQSFPEQIEEVWWVPVPARLIELQKHQNKPYGWLAGEGGGAFPSAGPLLGQAEN